MYLAPENPECAGHDDGCSNDDVDDELTGDDRVLGLARTLLQDIVVDRLNTQATHQQHNDKPVGFYGPIAPPGPNAPSSECPPNVVPNSEFRTCPDPEFPNELHSEFMNTPNVEFLNIPLCSAAISYLAGSALMLAASTRCWRQAHSTGRRCHVHTSVMAIGADFKMYLLRQFCSNRVKFFYNTQETQTRKMMDQNFEIRLL